MRWATQAPTTRSRRPASTLRLWQQPNTVGQSSSRANKWLCPCWPPKKRKCWRGCCPAAAGNAQACVAQRGECRVALTQSTITHTTQHTPTSKHAASGWCWLHSGHRYVFVWAGAAAPAGVNNRQEPCLNRQAITQVRVQRRQHCQCMHACMVYQHTLSCCRCAHKHDSRNPSNRAAAQPTVVQRCTTHPTAATRWAPPRCPSQVLH
jgi:hypothetical protein